LGEREYEFHETIFQTSPYGKKKGKEVDEIKIHEYILYCMIVWKKQQKVSMRHGYMYSRVVYEFTSLLLVKREPRQNN
jgi:hypothetical protein